MKRAFQLAFVFWVIARLLFFFTASPAPIAVQGYFFESQHWDQFGQVLVLENRQTGERLSQTLPPNGHFSWNALLPGRYQLFWQAQFATRFLLSDFESGARPVDLGVLIAASHEKLHFPWLSLIPLAISSFYLIFAILLTLKTQDKVLSRLFLLMSLPPFWFTSLDSIQNLLAYFHFEKWAAQLFYLKDFPLYLSGSALLVFFLHFSGSKRGLGWLDQGRVLIVPGLVMGVMALSAFILNQEYLYQQLWGFPFSTQVKFNIFWVLLGLLWGLMLSLLRFRALDTDTQKKVKTLLFSSLIFVGVYIPLIGIPVLFFESREFFKGEYVLMSSAGVLFLFLSFAKAIFADHWVDFEVIQNRKFLYLIFHGLLGLIYLSLAMSMLTLDFAQKLWMMPFFLFGFEPLRKLTRSFLDYLFAPGIKNRTQILQEFSEELLTSLDPQHIQDTISRLLKRYEPRMQFDFFLSEKDTLPSPPQMGTTQDWILALKSKKLIRISTEKYKHCYGIGFAQRDSLEGWLILGLPASVHPFSAEDQVFFAAFAEQVSIALLNAKLFQDLKKSYEEYRKSQEKIELMNRLGMMGQISASLAHEIKNPLSAMSNFVQLLETQYEDPEFRKDFMAVLPRQIERIQRLIDQMLSYGKTQDIKITLFSLSDLCRHNLKLLEQQAKQSNVTIQFENESDLHIESDEKLWNEILLNLFLNALQSMPSGGRLKVSLKQAEQKLKLTVEDQGFGIPAEDLKKIFEPFYTTKTRGTGLGLALVHKNLTQLGYALKVESTVGVGSQFTILS